MVLIIIIHHQNLVLVIEFDTKPTCYEAPSNVVEEFSGRKCNTQIKDGEVLSGSTVLVDWSKLIQKEQVLS